MRRRIPATRESIERDNGMSYDEEDTCDTQEGSLKALSQHGNLR
jgi:hypothetical protein